MTLDGRLRVEISEEALRSNLERLSERFSFSVNDDAFGHGSAVAERLRRLAQSRQAADDSDLLDALGLPDHTGVLHGIPVMRAYGQVLQVKRASAGEGVSYGYRYRLSADSNLALVTGGYGHGVVRGLGGKVSVAINEERHPIVGRVAMDVCVVDLGEVTAEPGENVCFFGDPHLGQPPLSEWTAAVGMTAVELTAVIGQRGEVSVI